MSCLSWTKYTPTVIGSSGSMAICPSMNTCMLDDSVIGRSRAVASLVPSPEWDTLVCVWGVGGHYPLVQLLQITGELPLPS